MEERWGYTIFCDDIRQEVGEKVTFVGAYSSVMYVQGRFPAQIAKFALGISFRELMGIEQKPTEIVVMLPGESLEDASIRIPLPEGDQRPVVQRFDQVLSSEEQDASMEIFTTAPINLILTPLNLKQEGYIKVRALIDGKEEIKLGALVIAAAPEQESDRS